MLKAILPCGRDMILFSFFFTFVRQQIVDNFIDYIHFYDVIPVPSVTFAQTDKLSVECQLLTALKTIGIETSNRI